MNNKLLYLEDDQALAQVTIRALTKRNFDLTHITSMKEFSEINKNEIKKYSHALLDLRLDDGHTLETIAYLKSLNAPIKIVILTGYASIATSVQAIKSGAHNYLAKPATIDQILLAFEDTQTASEINFDEENVPSLRRLEWEHIQQTLAENKGNISATARQLNMHRRTLQRKLAKKPGQ